MKHVWNKAIDQVSWLKSNREVGWDVMRVLLGIILLYKGVDYLRYPAHLTDWLGPASEGLRNFIIAGSIVGGAMLALGVLTRVAALVLIPVMTLTSFYLLFPQIGANEARTDFEYSVLALAMVALYALIGSGQYSVDYYWTQVRRHTGESATPVTPQQGQA